MSRPHRPISVKPAFIPASAGDLFTLYLCGKDTPPTEHTVLFLPPFAEELNKSRRMIALQAQQFARAGLGVLIPDLYGTGDSEGDFSQASWQLWQRDVATAVDWLLDQGVARITLWGMRLGAHLALESIPLLAGRLERILLWAPVIRGDQMMTQFLRLRLAADMMTEGEKISTQDLRAQLAAGREVEVAGYTLSARLVSEVDKLNLTTLIPDAWPPIDWFDLAATGSTSPNVAGQRVRTAWSDAGAQVRHHLVTGASFWNTPEITLVPELLARTSEVMAEQQDSGGQAHGG